jgi:hypothetical protein
MHGIRVGVLLSALLLGAAGCASTDVATETARSDIRIVPDDPVHPRHVRFEVPTVLLLGHPGPHPVPSTLTARIATRDLAARELAAHHYCPHGFTGPEGIFFAEGDRGRSAFVVHCRG